jgi:hypothetical protein
MTELKDVSIGEVPTLLSLSRLVSWLIDIEVSRKAGIFSEENARLCRRLVIDNYLEVMGDAAALLEQKREQFEDWLRETVLKEVLCESRGSARRSIFSCCICTVGGERVVEFN